MNLPTQCIFKQSIERLVLAFPHIGRGGWSMHGQSLLAYVQGVDAGYMASGWRIDVVPADW